MSLTKIWIFSIKSPHTASSESFTSLWKEVLQFCRAHAPPDANHGLWQDMSDTSRVVMLSGYPSQEATDSADAEYVKTYGPRMAEIVSHIALYQLAADMGSLPHGPDALVIRVMEGGDRTDWNTPSYIDSIVSGEFGDEDKLDAKKPQAERKGIYIRLTGIHGTDASYWLGNDDPGFVTYACKKLPL